MGKVKGQLQKFISGGTKKKKWVTQIFSLLTIKIISFMLSIWGLHWKS